MSIALWPIVARTQLVQVFRPGEPPEAEAPYRTLRSHGWATAGVSVVTRNAGRATGRFTLFSVLNVAAARSARVGDARSARAFARAAERLERGAGFTRLKELLKGRSLTTVTETVRGGVTDTGLELANAIRDVARETRSLGPSPQLGTDLAVVAGRIAETHPDALVLESETGSRMLVPRWLAKGTGRQAVGEALALMTDRLDDTQVVVTAVAAIDLAREKRRQPGPFGRAAPVRALRPADVRLLSRTPAPLEVLVPVVIDA
ncbi:MAG: hypothetical protein JNJ54_34495 [Myxococcaceae bacterium]|nr:hypothetical protein [Myxococcaceae bacterium]